MRASGRELSGPTLAELHEKNLAARKCPGCINLETILKSRELEITKLKLELVRMRNGTDSESGD